MTTAEASAGSGQPSTESPGLSGWALARSQLLGVLRFELRRSLLAKRAWACYVLALLPFPVLLLWGFAADHERGPGIGQAPTMFGVIFALYVGVPLFLGTLFVFMSQFRSDILERSLHYYYLTPIPRSLLVAGKYLAALIATVATFASATVAMYLLFYVHWGFGELMTHLLRGGGAGQLMGYVGIAVLGCLGYGSLFLAVGLVFRNPVVPAAVIWAWEFINFLLPPLLKKLSVIHYLKSLYPVPLPEGLFAVVAEPTSAWISVPGLLLFTTAVLALAAWRARTMDINYGSD